MGDDDLALFLVIMGVLLAGLTCFGVWVYRFVKPRIESLALRADDLHRDRLANRPEGDVFTEKWMSVMPEETAISNQPNGPSHQFDCKGCGAGLDPMLTACSYCGRPHNRIDMNTMPTELIIQNAVTWVGMLEELGPSGVMLRPGTGAWVGDQLTVAEINAGARQYLSILDIRSERDPLAKRKHSELAHDFKAAKQQFTRRKKKFRRLIIALFALPLVAVFLLAIFA